MSVNHASPIYRFLFPLAKRITKRNIRTLVAAVGSPPTPRQARTRSLTCSTAAARLVETTADAACHVKEAVAHASQGALFTSLSRSYSVYCVYAVTQPKKKVPSHPKAWNFWRTAQNTRNGRLNRLINSIVAPTDQSLRSSAAAMQFAFVIVPHARCKKSRAKERLDRHSLGEGLCSRASSLAAEIEWCRGRGGLHHRGCSARRWS